MDVLVAAADAAAPVAPPADPHAAMVTPPPLVYAASNQRVSEEHRWACVAYRKDGWTFAMISRRIGCNEKTASRIWERYLRTGAVKSGGRSGRPRATTEEQEVNIVVTARVLKFTSPRRIKQELNLAVSRITIDRRLQEANLFGRVAVHKRKYTEAEVRKRLAFANGYKDWTKEQWEKVIFSDEKTFYGYGFCGRIWVRREPGEALNPKYTIHTTPHPVKINVWGCFCAAGVGYSYIFNENMDAAKMKSIISTHLIPSAKLHYSFDPPEQWYLLHDNDKKFKSGLVTAELHNKGVTTIDFPPYSPDLNPIENLWNIHARLVEAREKADTIEKLQDIVAEEWNTINNNKQLLKTLAHSMPARIQAVLDAHGFHTKY